MQSTTFLSLGRSGGGHRPAIVRQLSLPPWEAGDLFGQVHTVPPPEYVPPPLDKPHPLFMRADFNGVCLNLHRWDIRIDFQHNWVIGANSTPFNMLMTPMAPMYSREIQTALFTEHAERGYWDFVVAPDGWNMELNGFAFTPQSYVAWTLLVKSWGFAVVHWQKDPDPNHPLLLAALRARSIDKVVFGKEVDAIPGYTSEAYDDALRQLLVVMRAVGSVLPIYAHFTANYPDGFPRDTYLTNWSDFDGLVHLAWQAGAYGRGDKGDSEDGRWKTDSAGKMGAMLYYARRRVALGEVGGNGKLALKSVVTCFETMASDQLYGLCDELQGKRRTTELNYCTRNDPRIPALSGYGNGGSQADGWPL